MFATDNLSSLEDLAHVIQVALTPVFLLSAIAALLNVFSTRLGRVADQVDRAARELETADAKRSAFLNAQLAYLRRRSWVLDIAVVLGAAGGIGTCAATLVLFVGALRDRLAGSVLFLLFAGGLVCTVGALAAFLIEMLMASRGLRLRSLEGR
ncbi:MAG: hypothetical protein QOJ52_4292 [Acidimicrobiaceae bacterium]|jgi:hypothetical protein|nr:hypothetical protein [Acidimicrobiaceae bacterium]